MLLWHIDSLTLFKDLLNANCKPKRNQQQQQKKTTQNSAAHFRFAELLSSFVAGRRPLKGGNNMLKHILSYFKKVYFHDRFIVCNYFNARCLRT